MTNIVISDKQTTTSMNVANVFGKEHRDVTRAINSLDCSDEFRARNYTLSYYVSSQNKKIKCVDITRDGFAFLCMGFTGKKSAQFKEAYINEFNRMSSSINSISDRVNELELERLEIKEAGSRWSSIGREICASKKDHTERSNNLMDEIQLKIEF